MPVRVLIAVLVILLVCLLAAAADRAVKAIKRERRRLEATRRLAAAAAQAEAQAEARDRQRKAAEQVSGALNSVMPTIHDIDTRHVTEPGETTST